MSDHVARMTAEWSPGRAVNEERLAAPLHSIDCGTAYRGCAPGCPKDQAEPRCHCGAYATSDDGKTCCEPGHEARLAAKLASAPPAEAKGDQHCRWGICALPHTELTREEFATAINRMAVSAHGIAKVLAHDDSLRTRAREAEERAEKTTEHLLNSVAKAVRRGDELESERDEARQEARWLAEVFIATGHATPDIHAWLDRAKHCVGTLRESLTAANERVDALLLERDEAREQREDLANEILAERSDLAAANARAEEAERKALMAGQDKVAAQRRADSSHRLMENERAARLKAEKEMNLLIGRDVPRLEERLAAAEAEVKRRDEYPHPCLICFGVRPASGKPCACNGTNNVYTAFDYLNAEAARLRLAYDDPTTDATDGAHPAWWRGSDAGVAGAVRIVNEALDGPLPLAGCVGGADLEAVRQRAAALRARAQRLEKAGDALVCRIDPDGYGRPALAAWAAAKEQK